MKTSKLSFSQRLGLEPIEIPLQVNEINDGLRIALWNAFYIYIYQEIDRSNNGSRRAGCREFHLYLWMYFFKRSADEFPSQDYQFRAFIKDHIQISDWNKVYEFFEFLFDHHEKRHYYDWEEFLIQISLKLKEYNAGVTIIDLAFTPITNEEEIKEIKMVQDSSRAYQLNGVLEHLNTSLQLISKKPMPDYRNSIKESISMVEAIARIIEPTENTLGKALNKLDKNGKINPMLKAGFEKLYAYTNDKNGIRHSLMDDSTLSIEDARFFLISCSAFTNYLIEKAKRENLI